MKPTKEQIQWLWEQCGLRMIDPSTKFPIWVDGQDIVVGTMGKEPPNIDLNNLFKYGFPLLWQREVVEISFGKDFCYLDYGYGKPDILVVGDNLEDNLFNAIYKALGGKE